MPFRLMNIGALSAVQHVEPLLELNRTLDMNLCCLQQGRPLCFCIPLLPPHLVIFNLAFCGVMHTLSTLSRGAFTYVCCTSLFHKAFVELMAAIRDLMTSGCLVELDQNSPQATA